MGILVFQVSNVKIETMRGFSIAETPYPTIILNRSDSAYGRIFTAVHEFAHLVIQTAEKYALASGTIIASDTESYANAIAAAILLPKTELLDLSVVKGHIGSDWTEDDLKLVQKHFIVSKEAVLRRLLALKKTSPAFYNQKVKEWNAVPLKKGGGAEMPYEKAIRSNSVIFMNIVMNAYQDHELTQAKLVKILHLKAKYLPKLEELMNES